MNKIKKSSSADHADTHKRLLFLSMFLLSLIFAIETGSYFVGESVGNFLSITAKVFVGLLFISIFFTVFWKIKFIPGDKRYLVNSEDSFVAHALNKACKISWILTFIILTVITVTTGRESSTFPAQFYINLAQFSMTAVFSISFFILFRDSGDENVIEVVK
jgi:energy-coupling factor transporter transmembrane protein EcfT